MTQSPIQFNFSSGPSTKGVQICREGATGGISIKSVDLGRFLRENICMIRRTEKAFLLRGSKAFECRSLIVPDVTFFFVAKIVSNSGYVKLSVEPKFRRCDYAC